MTIPELIKKWKINMPILAKEMGMPLGTFKNKIGSTDKYNFTDKEKTKLLKALKDLGADIKQLKK